MIIKKRQQLEISNAIYMDYLIVMTSTVTHLRQNHKYLWSEVNKIITK